MVQVMRRLALLVDIVEYPVHMLDGQVGGSGNVHDGHAIVLTEQAQVH